MQCRLARIGLSISRIELAQRADVAERTIADFESGKRKPIRGTLDKLERVLAAAGAEFLDGDDDAEAGVLFRKRK